MAPFKASYGDPFLSPKVRLQYVNVEKPDDGHKFSRKGKYVVTALIPKSDKKGLKMLLQQVADTAGCELDEVEEEVSKHPLLDGKGNLRDGDSKKNVKKEGHAGHYIFITSSDNQPDTYAIEDEGDEPESVPPGEIYSGCYAQLVLQPATYEGEEGDICVTFYLQGVIKVEDGDKFKGGRVDVKSLFANWGGADASAAKKGKKEKLNGKSRHVEEEDEDTDEEEAAPKKRKAKPQEEEDEEDEAPKKRKSKKVEEEEEDEDEPVIKKRKSKKPQEEEDDEDEEDEKPKVRERKTKGGFESLLDE